MWTQDTDTLFLGAKAPQLSVFHIFVHKLTDCIPQNTRKKWSRESQMHTIKTSYCPSLKSTGWSESDALSMRAPKLDL